MYNIAVFVSGRGSNLISLFNNCDKEKIKICAVVSDKLNCGALDFAKENSINTFSVDEKEKENFISYLSLGRKLKDLNIDLIVLAGFLKKIPEYFIDDFENRIINIHPALLPSFGGKGMFGANVHKAVFESSAKVSGATVHFVDKVYDNGKIIAQTAVDIYDVDSYEEIADRVLKIEHKLLPFVVTKFSENKIITVNNRVKILD